MLCKKPGRSICDPNFISPSCIESAIGDVHLTCGGVITIQKTHYCTIAWRDRLSFHKQLAAHQADTTNWLSQHVAMTLTMGKICKNTWQNNGGEVPSALQSCTWNLAVKSGRTPRHTHHPPTLPAVSPFPAKTLWQGAITDAPGCGGPTMGWIEDRSIICIAVFWIHKCMYIYIYVYTNMNVCLPIIDNAIESCWNWTCFKHDANMFLNFFGQQCSLLKEIRVAYRLLLYRR